jgi:hypothetical protein
MKLQSIESQIHLMKRQNSSLVNGEYFKMSLNEMLLENAKEFLRLHRGFNVP